MPGALARGDCLTVLFCPPEITFETVDVIHRGWVDAVDIDTVDASGVTQIDTAGLQLLLALLLSLHRAGRPWSWVGVSDAVRQTAQRLGLSDMLLIPVPSKGAA